MISSEFGATIQETMDEFNTRFKEFEMLKNSNSLFNYLLSIVSEKQQTDIKLELCDFPSCRAGKKWDQISLSCYFMDDSQMCEIWTQHDVDI